jgi:hypothetical protein
MKDELISFSTAKLAKEKGFDEETENQWWYALQEDGDVDLQDNDNYTRKEAFFAPTQSLLQRWLREKHGIHVDVSVNEICWSYRLDNPPRDGSIIFDLRSSIGGQMFKTYEQALEAGLKKALKLIKS